MSILLQLYISEYIKSKYFKNRSQIQSHLLENSNYGREFYASKTMCKERQICSDNFSREGYKISEMFGRKSLSSKEIMFQWLLGQQKPPSKVFSVLSFGNFVLPFISGRSFQNWPLKYCDKNFETLALYHMDHFGFGRFKHHKIVFEPLVSDLQQIFSEVYQILVTSEVFFSSRRSIT